MSDGDGSEEAVRVFVRIRPLNKRELAEKQTIGWNFNETSMLEDTPNGTRVYAFDHCFSTTSTNQETYDIVGKPVVLKAMEGYNGTVFTYGQTGSGKTWTMRGSESEPGMMVLCVRDILEWVRSHPDIQYKIRVAYLEVYNEEINDLLGEPGLASKNLKIVSEDALRGAVIGGLVEEDASTSDQFMEILRRGEQSRSYASTNMNAESSRSHTIYRITIEARGGGTNQVEEEDSLMGGGGGGSSASSGRVSYLNLVDLAGSERQKSTKAEGKVLKEGANINKSLLALGAVIKKLGEVSKIKKGADKSASFIPYRDSKLTRILKQSLGGNALTSVLCTVTPAPMHREETVSTLKFGQLCKSIKNTVKASDGLMDDKALIKQYRQSIAELKAQIDGMMAGGFGDGHVKAAFESKLKNIEAFMASKGIAPQEISAVLSAATAGTEGDANDDGSGGGGGQANNEMVTILNEKIAFLQSRLTVLQEENAELLQMKSSYEEDEQRLQEIHDEMSKVEEERKVLQNERFKVLRDSKALDEKESRIGTLLTNLDDKESKLRLKLANMQDQLSQWQRSIADLQKREDLVEEWKRSHEQKEKKLEEMKKQQERKYQELEEREKKITEEENKAKQQHKELAEREQRLQIGLSRVANGEIANTQKEESLQAFEAQLKKKEQECDIRERELSSRRKEMESWDVLLREKDRKILNEQRTLDEREQAISTSEEKVKSREIENERRALEIKQKEAAATELGQKYDKLLSEVEERERDLKERDREYQSLRKELGNREEELRKWEKQLMKLQEQMKGLDQRERHLKNAEEVFRKNEAEFYNVKVAQITSRHSAELKKLEDVIAKQLKITGDFQKELDSTRAELSAKTHEMSELEETLQSRQAIIEQLREQLKKIEQGGHVNGLVATGGALEGDGSAPSTSSTAAAPMNVNELDTTNGGGHLGAGGKSGAFHHGGGGFGNGGGGGANGGSGGNAANLHSLLSEGLTTQQFITQLAVTRKIIYQVLEQYDALPEAPSSTVLKRNIPVRLVVAQPPPAGRGAVPVYGQSSAVPPPPPPPPPALPATSSTHHMPRTMSNNANASGGMMAVGGGADMGGDAGGGSVPLMRAPSHGGVEDVGGGGGHHLAPMSSSQSSMPRMGSLQQLFPAIGGSPSASDDIPFLSAPSFHSPPQSSSQTSAGAAVSGPPSDGAREVAHGQSVSNVGAAATAATAAFRNRKNAVSSSMLQTSGTGSPPYASRSQSMVEEEKDSPSGRSQPPPPPPAASSHTPVASWGSSSSLPASLAFAAGGASSSVPFRSPLQPGAMGGATPTGAHKSSSISLSSPAGGRYGAAAGNASTTMAAGGAATATGLHANRSMPTMTTPRSMQSPTSAPFAAASSATQAPGVSKRNAILSPFGSQHKTVASIVSSGDEQAAAIAKVSLDMKSGFKKVAREYEAIHGGSAASLSSPSASSPAVVRSGGLFSPASGAALSTKGPR